MIPGRYNITVYKGTTYTNTITALSQENGVTVDFSKYTNLRLQVREPWMNEYQSSTTPLLEMTTENGRLSIVNNGLAIQLLLDSEETTALTFNSGVYALELVEMVEGLPDVVDPILIGSFSVIREVTL
jgi:hypothetical protein